MTPITTPRTSRAGHAPARRFRTSVVLVALALACTDGGLPTGPIVGSHASRNEDDPGTISSLERANFVTTVTGGLNPIYSAVGKVYLSTDAIGMTGSSGVLQVDKHAGATVRKAYIFSATVPNGAAIPDGGVKINGTNVTWDLTIVSPMASKNYAADVTTLVKSIVDAAPAGRVNLTISETATNSTDGEIVAVVFDDAALLQDNTVTLMFGAQKPAGDDFFIGLANPLDVSNPSLRLEMGVGISFGFQGENNFGQSSFLDVNGTRMSSCAGGNDDGAAANGALITVGGLDDLPANPTNPCNGSLGLRADDELYDLRPFTSNGATQIQIHTQNPSNDDNIFFAGLFMTVAANITVLPPSDVTPPSIVPTVTGTLGANNWYTSNATVSWAVTDGQSAVTSTTGCGTTTLSTDNAGITYTCSATSAGGTASNSVTIKLDATVPTITPSVTGPTGTNGWFVGNVAVSFATSGSVSGVTNGPGCSPVSITTDGTTSYTCTATSGAGLTNSTTVSVKRDATAPVVIGTPNGVLGTNGWYTSNVTVSWSATDNLSGTSATPCAVNSLNADVASVTYSCAATDAAGLSASASVTVKRDATTPTVTPSITGNLGNNGWYTSDVGVSFATSGSVSGVSNDAGCAATSLTTDGAASYTCTATSGAGLTSSATVSVKRDATAPVVTGTPSGVVGTNGWYTSDVSVAWSATDNLSGTPSVPCSTNVLSSDAASITYSCTATDGAGLSSSASVTVKRDATTPSVTPTVTGPAGENDWYVGDVGVAFATSGSVSGVTNSAGCSGATITTDGTTSYTCTATSGAGLTNGSTVTVKRDATPPVVTGTPSGVVGANGWYTSNVTVSWSATDNVSGTMAVPCVPNILALDVATVTYTCSATNGAGLSASSAVTVKRDATIPTIIPSVTGPAGANGWYVGDVSVAFATSGSVSGVTNDAGCSGTTVTADGIASYSCTATSGAGLSNSSTVTVKRDATPPVVVGTPSGTLGNNGWYVGNVTVSWSASDATSGTTAVPCAANTLATDAASVTYSCSATNGAGLSSSSSVTVKRDVTVPVIGYSGNAGSYTIDQTIAINCAASDAMSGLVTNTCQNVTGAAYTFALGSHTYSANATDMAGNANSATTSFTVSVTTGSLCALVKQFVTQHGIVNSLCVKLENSQKSLDKGNTTASNNQLDAFINEVSAQAGKFVPAVAAPILSQLAQALKQ